MMNSTNNDKMKAVMADVEQRFDVIGFTIMQDQEVHVDLPTEEIHSALSYLKTYGYKQLSAVTCVDWLEEGKFQLIFNIYNWDSGNRLILRTKLDRTGKGGLAPIFTTITTIYNGAKYYEREVHEFFGIEFEGNEDAKKQLFLERWDDIPPLRKDFNARAYSDKKYIKREYQTTFGEKGGEPFERN